MSESLAVSGATASQAANAQAQLLDPRRKLQLGLGVIWLLDGILQLQPFMFGKGFPQMLAGNASGNPALVARPITWSAGFIDHHLVIIPFGIMGWCPSSAAQPWPWTCSPPGARGGWAHRR
jgi:hypothetical protein